ncbi:MAG: DUF4288 domain-containing protein [Bacteroidia bacterium]
MKWFTAKLVYTIEKNAEGLASEMEEKLILIEASSRLDALIKARQIGIEKQEEISLFNGNTLFWKFIEVVSLNEIEKWESGVELFSCTKELDSMSQLDYMKYQGLKLMMS